MVTVAEAEVRFKGSPGTLLQDARTHGARAGEAGGTAFGESFNEAGKRLIAGFIGAELVLRTVDTIKEAIAAAQQDALATDQLTTAIRTNAGARKEDVDVIERQVAAAQRLGFTDNQVKASLTSLVTATKDLGRATQDQNLAFDLARFKHISLQDATQSLVAVEAGRFRGLAQLGIQIQAGATKEEALAAIRARVAGQAETFANTDAGAAARRDAAYDKLLETIGAKLLPIITQLSNFTTDVVIPGVTGVIDVVGVLSPAIEALGVALITKAAFGFGQAALGAIGFGGAATLAGSEVAAASVVEVGAVGTVATAFDGLKSSAVAAWLASLGPAALVAGAGAAFVLLVNKMDETNAAQLKTALSAQNLTGAQARLKAQAEAGAISWDQYDVQVDQVARQQELQARTAVLAAGGTNAAAEAAGKAAAANDRGTDAIVAHTSATVDDINATNANADAGANLAGTSTSLARNIDEVTSAAGDSFDALNANVQAEADVTRGAGATALALQGMGNEAATAGFKFATLADAYRAWTSAAAGHRTATDAIPGAFGTDTVPTGGQSLASWYLDELDRINHSQALLTTNVKATHAGLSDTARVAKLDLTNAFRDAKTTVDALFDALHAKRLRDIDDTRQQAYATAARTAAEARYNLEQARQALLAPVDAEQAAFDADQQAAQRKGLQQAVTDAARAKRENTDPGQWKALTQAFRDAQQALKDFDRQAQINADRAAAQKAADALTASHVIDPVTGKTDIDANEEHAKAVADAAATTATNNENAKAAREKKAFDDTLTRLEKELEAVKSPAKRQAILNEIQTLYDKNGLNAEGKAFINGANIALATAAGLKSETKAVEDAAQGLVAAIAKYLNLPTGTKTSGASGHSTKIPSNAAGDWNTQEGLHYLHDGEMVVPATPAARLREALMPDYSAPGAAVAYAHDGQQQARAGAAGTAIEPWGHALREAGQPFNVRTTIDLGYVFEKIFGGDRLIDIVDKGLINKYRGTIR